MRSKANTYSKLEATINMVQEGISSLDKNNLLNALRSKQESVLTETN